MTASYFEIAHSVATLIKYRVSGHGVIIGMSDIAVDCRLTFKWAVYQRYSQQDQVNKQYAYVM